MPIDAVIDSMSTSPYRIDTAGTGKGSLNCVYYDVPTSSSNEDPAGSRSIELFLHQNRSGITALMSIAGVTFKDLDIGVLFPDSSASVSRNLDNSLLALAASLGLSITISVYRTDGTV